MAESNGKGVVSSRPTIAIAGRNVSELSDALLSLRIEERVDGLYHCEATLGNWGPSGSTTTFLYFDRKLLEFGKELAIKSGAGDTIFQGRIAGLEASFPEGRSPTITVLAEDRFQDLRMTRRTRTFADLSDGDVIKQVASDHSLRPDVDVGGGKHKVLAQLNQSDLAFLRERARAVDAELWIDGTTLSAKWRTKRNGGSVKLGYGNQLREFTVIADLAGQRTSITVTGWDVAGKTGLKETASDSVLGGELKGGTSGPSILGSSLGTRKETVAHSVPITGQEAKARAEAIFKQRARRFLRGRGTAELDPKLRVGAFAKLEGLGPLFNGEYYVAEVRHLFDGAAGLRTEFVGEKPGLGDVAMTALTELTTGVAVARWFGVYVALVKDVKDPDGQGRVKVALPWVPDSDGGAYEAWARLATLMGGNNRGSWFVPDVEDEVLVGFEFGDPRRPYVLGALWNGSDKPPESMDGSGNNNKKVLRSRNGVKITLDDQSGQETLLLETPGGQKITLKDGPGSIEAVDANGNSIKLESSGITVRSSAKVTVSASTVEVSAGMLTVNAGMSKFSGVVQADTVITNSVVSTSYTPGAGNIW